jgi:nucleoside-diphosphate-sugar epimerase
MKTIAVVGASGHVGKSLCQSIEEDGRFNLLPCSRSSGNINEWARTTVDVVVNCVGVGSPLKVRALERDVFSMTDTTDNRILEWLRTHDRLYIFISSGAIHYRKDCYAIAKRCAELKHRALEQQAIVDLRLFNYITEHINIGDGYLITELLRAILDKKPFVTYNIDVEKDFTGRHELWRAVLAAIGHPGNAAYDVYSKAPTTKFDIMAFCGLQYNMAFRVKGGKRTTLSKYTPTEHGLQKIGYEPQRDSTQCIKEAFDAIIG